MRRIYIFIITIMCLGSYTAMAQKTLTAAITFQNFYDELAPYGTWINYPGYGQVWHPDVSGDFRPYATNGYWENTDQGLYWQSGYEWGWAPFHYGRWFYDDTYGWLWEPGNEWAPAWVTWGEAGDYYAWAPVAPEMITGSNSRPHSYYWNMVDHNDLYDRDLGQYFVDENRLQTLATGITVRQSSPVYATSQPEASRTVREAAEPVHVEHVSVAPADNSIPVYRPSVEVMQSVNPVQFRRVPVESISPLRENDRWPVNDFRTHQENIQRLPMAGPDMYDELPLMHVPGEGR